MNTPRSHLVRKKDLFNRSEDFIKRKIIKCTIYLQAISDLTKKTPTMDVKNSDADVAKAIKVAPATSF